MSLNIHEIKSNQLQRYRKKRSFCQRDVAKLLGAEQASEIYRWEKGQRMPSLINALKLSSALKCPVEILFLDHFNQIRKEMYQDEI